MGLNNFKSQNTQNRVFILFQTPYFDSIDGYYYFYVLSCDESILFDSYNSWLESTDIQFLTTSNFHVLESWKEKIKK